MIIFFIGLLKSSFTSTLQIVFSLFGKNRQINSPEVSSLGAILIMVVGEVVPQLRVETSDHVIFMLELHCRKKFNRKGICLFVKNELQ